MRANLDLCHEVVRSGDNEHERFPGGDYTVQRVYHRLVYDPTLRRTNIDALELIFSRNTALARLSNFCIDFTEFLIDLTAMVTVYLQDLHFDLDYLAAYLRRCRDQLRSLAGEPSCLSLD